METDRWAILTLRAAARGTIDFGRCDPLSRRWWDKITRVLNAMSREDNIQAYDAALRLHLALLGSPHVSEDGFKEAAGKAEDAFRDLLGAMQPWLKRSKTSAQEETVNELVARYKEKCGDPNDPVFMQALRESIALRAAERAQKRASKELTSDQALDRRLQARDQRQQYKPPVRKPRRG